MTVAFPEPLASLTLLALGLILGSFVNVCIHRLPLGESVVAPRSRCPECRVMIRWYQNIPLVSWIALRGRCAACNASISPRYPLVEALCGLVLLGLWLGFGPRLEFLVAAPFVLAMVVLFFTDFDHQLLPDVVTLSGVMVGLALAWYNPFLGDPGWKRLWLSLSGAALGSGFLWAVGAIYGRLRGVEAMGLGDVKMMAMVGAFVGPAGVLFTIFGASIVGAVFGLLLVPLRGRTLQDTLPFGCFLAPAAVAALLVGRQATSAYFALLFPGP